MKHLAGLISLVSSVLFLSACDQSEKLTSQLTQIENRIQAAEQHGTEVSNRLSALDARLATIVQTLNTNADELAKHEKLGASRLAASEEVLKQLQEIRSDLNTLAKNSATDRQSAERKITELSGQVSNAAKAPTPLRWAYVDKSRVQREVGPLFQAAPLPADQDPTKNPELAKTLAEYQALQLRAFELNSSMHRVMAGGPASVPGQLSTPDNASKDDPSTMQKRMIELSATLAPYLSQQQKNSQLVDTRMQAAFREYCRGKFDLLIDKTFGDHSIHYKSDLPVQDVTDQVIEYITTNMKKP